MRALVVVDAQNEFSAAGRRPVPNHPQALAAIREHVEVARQRREPIDWIGGAPDGIVSSAPAHPWSFLTGERFRS